MFRSRQLPLRSALMMPFAIIFLCTIGTIIGIQKYSYEKILVDASNRHLNSITEHTVRRLSQFLEQPYRVSLSISHNIGYQSLYDQGDTSSVEDYLRFSFEKLFSRIDHVDVIGFGGEGGDYIGFRREQDDQLSLLLKDERTHGDLLIFAGDDISSSVLSTIEHYDPRVRPWYTPIKSNQIPMWSPIYANADDREEITLTALAPIFEQGEFQGVIGTDIRINTFNEFLADLAKNSSSLIYIVDQDKRIVAQSTSTPMISSGIATSKKDERIFASESESLVVNQTATLFNRQDLTEISQSTRPDSKRFDIEIEGERYFTFLTPFNDRYGLDWHIVVSTAEDDLTGQFYHHQVISWLMGGMVFIIGLLLSFLALNRVTTPITETVTAARKLAQGEWASSLPKAGNIYETNQLVTTFSEMATNLEASFNALRDQLVFDSLTGLYSREGLIRSAESQSPLTGYLVLIGINQFRSINESLGYNRGDQLLIDIAQRLKAQFGNETLIARIGGDEFAIYLTDIKNDNEVLTSANRLQALFSSPVNVEQEQVVTSISLGIVSSECANNDMAHWLRSGSIALSNAKSEESLISFYQQEMGTLSLQRTQLIAKMKLAIENQEFVPFYQPLADLNTGATIGAEALARWQSPVDGLVSPAQFIPIAEDTGMIGDIGEQILTQACQDLVQMTRSGQWQADFQMHVNLSVVQLRSPHLTAHLTQIIQKTGVDTRKLTLEITESKIVDSSSIVVQNLQAIRDLGIGIAIDDFGTGYSSLAYLHTLPYNHLKIDRTFINRLDEVQLENSVVAAIIQVSRGLNVSVVAEGIETEQQMQKLQQLGCPIGQGFYFGKPKPLVEWP